MNYFVPLPATRAFPLSRECTYHIHTKKAPLQMQKGFWMISISYYIPVLIPFLLQKRITTHTHHHVCVYHHL